jgi:pimeloyl-ACP methyl ester carboxylesterase
VRLPSSPDTSRRALLLAGAAAAGQSLLKQEIGTAGCDPKGSPRFEPVPIPQPVPVKEGIVPVPGGRLWYWDTEGEGEPVVLLHPATGSALIWGYQQPVFAASGYRVIAYSRRGHLRSDPASSEDPGSAAGDLNHLLDALAVQKLHLVGSAAGAIVGLDYAISHGSRLLTLTLACTLAGVEEEDFQAMLARVIPGGFREMPAEFRELGPSYRAANPEGVRQWLELERRALTGPRVAQRRLNEIRWSALERLKVPTLVLAGGADLYSPPPVLRAVARRLERAEMVTFPEVGHSAYWEAPSEFNDAVLRFLARHRG